jgi:acetylornithine deacetylase/succinyl-diaminopimelate desuccinylase-like protein
MPELLDDLRDVVRIPSVAFPGFPSEPVLAMADAAVGLLRRSGAADARLLDVPGGYPAVYAEVPGPAGSPTVLLYAHYDVQPAPPEQGWATDPWTPVDGPDGRLYGRGAADDKAGLVIHAGVLRALTAHGPLPVTVKVLIEGEEETVSHLEAFVDARPDLFAADAFVIADMGNPEVGHPALTTALRGDVSCTVTVRTLRHAAHSGVFGGPAPDALVALIRILATLHDDAGDTAVPGVTATTWTGAAVDEAAYRESAGLLDGVELVGRGSLATRLWARPSATVIGIDAPTVAEAANILIPEATAKVSMRIVPGTDAAAELERLMAHLRSVAPWGVQVDVRAVKTAWPFQVDQGNPALAAARDALAESYGREVSTLGSGGSIPLLDSLQRAAPHAGMVLWGSTDTARSRIHAGDESVDPSEIEHLVVAEALMLLRLGG